MSDDIEQSQDNNDIKSDGDSSTVNEQGFLDKLSEYKEFIAILIFFLGGFFWVFGFFATKKQVTDLTCVLEQNVQMLRGKMEYQFFNDLLEENKNQLRETRSKIRTAKENGQPISTLEDGADDFKDQRSTLKADRDKFKVKMEEALENLTKNNCFK